MSKNILIEVTSQGNFYCCKNNKNVVFSRFSTKHELESTVDLLFNISILKIVNKYTVSNGAKNKTYLKNLE